MNVEITGSSHTSNKMLSKIYKSQLNMSFHPAGISHRSKTRMYCISKTQKISKNLSKNKKMKNSKKSIKHKIHKKIKKIKNQQLNYNRMKKTSTQKTKKHKKI